MQLPKSKYLRAAFWSFLIAALATLAINLIAYFSRADVLESVMQIIDRPAYIVLQKLPFGIGFKLINRLQLPWSYIILLFLLPVLINGIIGGGIGILLVSVRDIHAPIKSAKSHLMLPKYKYFRTVMLWFFVASIGTIPLFLFLHILPGELSGLISTIFFWPANLALFLLGPFNLGVGPEAVGYQMAFAALYFFAAIPLNGIGWASIGFLHLLVKDVLRDGLGLHRKKVITVATLLSLSVGAVAFRIPSVINPLPPIATAISTCRNIQTGFTSYAADPEVQGFPQQINSWSELVDFLDSCCSFGLSEKEKNHRLTFISYKALKGPDTKARWNFGYVIYFSIYKQPDKYAQPFIEVTNYAVQQLTQEEYSVIPKIRDALMQFAEMSWDGRFPHQIKDWSTLVSICDENGANLEQTNAERKIRFISYEEKSASGVNYYILRLESRSPYRDLIEIRPY